MTTLNLYVGWIAILVGLLVGATIGLFFHNNDWLGGYGSWPRRMCRLGHIALIGTGLLNIFFALSVHVLDKEPEPRLAALLFLAGCVAMPAVCFLSAWKTPFRHLFFLPVVCLIGAVIALLFSLPLPT